MCYWTLIPVASERFALVIYLSHDTRAYTHVASTGRSEFPEAYRDNFPVTFLRTNFRDTLLFLCSFFF